MSDREPLLWTGSTHTSAQVPPETEREMVQRVEGEYRARTADRRSPGLVAGLLVAGLLVAVVLAIATVAAHWFWRLVELAWGVS